MKALLALLLLCATLTAAEPVFIIVTADTSWVDGPFSAKGEVEEVVADAPLGYVIAHGGRRFVVPRAHARVVSASEAALALLAHRQQLYAEIHAATAPVPTQRNGRPLPRNWINPDQADANHNAQELKRAIDANTRAVEQLKR